MSRYASNGGGPINASQEFKEMVKAFHDAGIEVFVSFTVCIWNVVFHAGSWIKILISIYDASNSQVILDVVYNHTNEADDEHPYTTSFRGIDNMVVLNLIVYEKVWSCVLTISLPYADYCTLSCNMLIDSTSKMPLENILLQLLTRGGFYSSVLAPLERILLYKCLHIYRWYACLHPLTNVSQLNILSGLDGFIYDLSNLWSFLSHLVSKSWQFEQLIVNLWCHMRAE